MNEKFIDNSIFSNETWGNCVGSIGPIAETCGGLDNDCDGQIDETGICGAVESPTDYVACYAFDEGSGDRVVDGSGNGNDGSVVGASWETVCKFGKCLNFDGVDDLVSVANNSQISFGDEDFAVSVWFNTTTAKEHNYLFSKN